MEEKIAHPDWRVFIIGHVQCRWNGIVLWLTTWWTVLLRKWIMLWWKRSKMKITVLLTINADGTYKLKLFIKKIAETLQSFEIIKILPTKYAANLNSWMISTHFLTSLNISLQKQKKKNILFIYLSCSTFNLQLKQGEFFFSVANCTNLLQPLDLSIIRAVKIN